MESQTAETKSVNVRGVPVDLWQRLKIQAVSEGITLQTALTEAIKQYVGRAA